MISAKDKIIIGIPVIEIAEDSATLRFPLAGFSEGDHLFFRVEKDFAGFLSLQADSALVALLFPAMMRGKDIEITGPVSPKLVFNIRQNVQPILLQIIPYLQPINIIADNAVVLDASENQNAVLTGVSNGVDSFNTILDHYLDPNVPDDLRITHLLFHAVGNQWCDKKAALMLTARTAKAQATADKFKLPLIKLSSNLDIYYLSTPFQQTHTLRNAAAAISLQSQSRAYLYSSGYHYKLIAVKTWNDTCVADPIILPLLSNEKMQCVAVGSGYTRVDKIKRISASDVAHGRLDVCVTDLENCSTCWKCARTLLTLELIGRLDNFADVFDLNRYRRIRSLYVAHVWAAHWQDPMCREIRDLMRETGYRMSLSEKFVGAMLFTVYRSVRDVVSKAVKIFKWAVTGKPMSQVTRYNYNVLWHKNLGLFLRLPQLLRTRVVVEEFLSQ